MYHRIPHFHFLRNFDIMALRRVANDYGPIVKARIAGNEEPSSPEDNGYRESRSSHSADRSSWLFMNRTLLVTALVSEGKGGIS